MAGFATRADYRDQLISLLPPGPAWTTPPGSVRFKLLDTLAVELARIDARMGDLLEESDPRATVELLPEWEAVAGLPDPCAGTPETIAGRQAALLRALTARGGQSRAYYIEIAAALGYPIEIDEFPAFTCDSGCEDALNPPPWNFWWRVRAPETTVIEFTCESGCDEALAIWGNEPLECVISRLKPAHTNVIFSYGEPPP